MAVVTSMQLSLYYSDCNTYTFIAADAEALQNCMINISILDVCPYNVTELKLTFSLLLNSLSCSCPSQAGCTIGDNGLSVKVGYRAPSDETSVVTFR